jgi:hypothetical protein
MKNVGKEANIELNNGVVRRLDAWILAGTQWFAHTISFSFKKQRLKNRWPAQGRCAAVRRSQ